MAYTGGKLNFSVAFNPTSAFPLDARSYFTSYAEALAAAESAEPAGSTNTAYYIGQKLLVVTEESADWYTITAAKGLQKEGSGGGVNFTTDDTLIIPSICRWSFSSTAILLPRQSFSHRR